MAYRAEILRSYLKPAYQYCEHKCSTKTSLLYRALLGPTATHGRAINHGPPLKKNRFLELDLPITRISAPGIPLLKISRKIGRKFHFEISLSLMILRSRRNVTLHYDGRRGEKKKE